MLAPPGVVISPPGWVRCVVTNVGPPSFRSSLSSSMGRLVRGRSRVELFDKQAPNYCSQIITEGEERASIAILASERTGYDVCAVRPR